MRIAVFSTHAFDRQFLDAANDTRGHELHYFDGRLSPATTALAQGFPAVCAFVNDELNGTVLESLASGGTRMIALRSAGFNHVDLPRARQLGFTVARVPAYSPHAVAEHTIALILALNRKIYRSYARVREGNFALDGLIGFDLYGRTAGIVGTGKIGAVVARILRGFGCTVLAYDVAPDEQCREIGVEYVPLDDLWTRSDIITLHAPLTRETRHGLKSERIAYVGLDVYEEEEHLFFQDLSSQVIKDDVFARVLTFPNVVVTAHQAFFTREALRAISETTLDNVTAFEDGRRSGNELY